MELVLKSLEERIELMIKALEGARTRESELNETINSLKGTIEELEGRLEDGARVAGRAEDLEKQNADLAQRLESVISLIDEALKSQPSSDEA